MQSPPGKCLLKKCSCFSGSPSSSTVTLLYTINTIQSIKVVEWLTTQSTVAATTTHPINDLLSLTVICFVLASTLIYKLSLSLSFFALLLSSCAEELASRLASSQWSLQVAVAKMQLVGCDSEMMRTRII